MADRIHKGLWQWLYRQSEVRTYHQVEVRHPWPSRETGDQLFRKVGEAIDLLAQHHPRALGVLQQHVMGVLVFGTVGSAGSWRASLRLIDLSERFVLREQTHPAHIAATLVHELTHVHLDRLGFGYDEADRARIERICYRSEAAFARRLPGGAPLAAFYEAAGERMLTIDHSNAAHLERKVSAMQQLGVPRWLARFSTWLRPRRVV